MPCLFAVMLDCSCYAPLPVLCDGFIRIKCSTLMGILSIAKPSFLFEADSQIRLRPFSCKHRKSIKFLI